MKKEGDRRGKTGRRVQRIEVGRVRRRGEGELERAQRIKGGGVSESWRGYKELKVRKEEGE